jgi:hypothetical protein
MAIIDAGPASLSTAEKAFAAAGGTAAVTAVTGTGTKVVTDAGATVTGMTVNELTTALITRISLLEYICVDGFNPITSGFAARRGARMTDASGLLVWEKIGSGDNDWRTNVRTTGTNATNITALDFTTYGDQTGGWKWRYAGTVRLAQSAALSITINGATTGLTKNGHYGTKGADWNHSSAADSNVVTVNASGAQAGAPFRIEVECPFARSGVFGQLIRVKTRAMYNPTTPVEMISDFIVEVPPSTVIATVGFVCNVATNVLAGGAYTYEEIVG